MKSVVILDTGPLVAWLCDTDEWHEWAVEQFGRLDPAFTLDRHFKHYRRHGRSVISLISPW